MDETGKHITLEMIQQVTRRTAMRYDRDGDDHYDIVSAYQKSMRGSDPTLPSTIWPVCWKRATCPRPAAG